MAKDIYVVGTTTADILADPDTPLVVSKNDSQLIYGEEFEVEGEHGDWFIGQSLIDGYKGHVHKSSVHKKIQDATHFINVRLTHIYDEPNFKTRPALDLSYLSRIGAQDDAQKENGFIETAAGWIFESHLTPIENMKNKNILDTAMQFLHTPYLYGGRSSLGIDCSGLVQIALLRNGMDCPRDSGDQSKIGEDIKLGEHFPGDLVFFPGHVGIFTTKDEVLNATSRTMNTQVEPLDTMIEAYKEITAIRRVKA